MNIVARIYPALVFMALYAAAVVADDSVVVRYLDGYPPANQSSEWINLRIARTGPPPMTADVAKQDVDRFFEQVAAVLAENKVMNDWQLAIPDAPVIEISIELNGRKITLVSCHTLLEQNGRYVVTEKGGEAVTENDRASVLSKQSESFRRHRTAFEKILKLTVERTRVRLSS
jgi:hypothetical protein